MTTANLQRRRGASPKPPAKAAYAELPYSSRRTPVIGAQMVATSQPLAAQAGLAVLAAGGNAIDAAIATAAALTVVEPTMNGLGSDAFALVWDGKRLHGLNGSGRAPARTTLSHFRGLSKVPELGWDAITVPGAVHAWRTLWRRFGSRPFAALLAPAIAYARHGFPVAPVIAAHWREQAPRFRRFREFARVFLPRGRAPAAGETFRNPDLAASLEELAATEGRSLYTGALALRTAEAAAAAHALLSFDDLGEHQSTWVEPLSLEFARVMVHELPPNGQGLASLVALGILDRLGSEHPPTNSADAVHLQVEAMKLAFGVCKRHVADPESMVRDPSALLSPSYLDSLARQVNARRACPPGGRLEREHGTVYLATADREGRMVSFIQSNYLGFGSGVVVPGTGIAIQNRALGFSLDPRHPNCIAGRKRPYHTIMPGFVTRAGKPSAAFGCMGGHMQPQGHVQLLLHLYRDRRNPQVACDAPRWYVSEDSQVALEPGFDSGVGPALAARGHTLLPSAPSMLFGGAQIIQRVGGAYWGGSDPRKDGQAIGI